MLNKVFLEPDGLSVGGTQLLTTGGGVSIANTLYVGANTITNNLTVTGTFNYPRANTTMPAFSAYNNIQIQVPTATVVPLPYSQVEYDTSNCYNPTNQPMYLNGIYTPAWSWAPNVPGYYQVNATNMIYTSAGATYTLQTILFKQVGIYRLAYCGMGGAVTSTISTVVFMNGVSDYLSVYGSQNSGIPFYIGSDSRYCSFNGCFLRPA